MKHPCKNFVLFVLFVVMFFVVAPAYATVNLTYHLRAASNDTMTAEAHAAANFTVMSDGRFTELNWLPTWYSSGTSTSGLPDGAFYFYFNRLTDFYKPGNIAINYSAANPIVTQYWHAYTNTLSVAITGLVSGSTAAWSIVSYPAEFTNSSAFALSFSNSATITPIPTGTYALSFPHLAGYSNTESITTNISGAPLVVALTNIYTAYDWSPGSTSTPPVPPPGTLPTNFPAATGGVYVIAGTNGVLLAPTNLWTANASNIAPAITSQLDYVRGVTVTTGETAASETNGSVVALTVPVSVGPTGATGATGATGEQGPAGPVTNQVVTYAGVVYTITNDPSAEGDVLYFDPATSNAYFGAAAAGLSLAEVQEAAPLMTNSAEVAIGKSANGSSSGAAIGGNANGSSAGAAVGYNANGSSFGAAIGGNANGSSFGAAIGYGAYGDSYGAAVGNSSLGRNYGAAVGYTALARYHGSALGAYANGTGTNIAIGARATATGGPNRTAIGYQTTNDTDNSTRVRGDLYLDGGTNIFVRETFGSGEFTPLAVGGSSELTRTYPVLCLPMGNSWADFELKASTDNFVNLVYYITSVPGVDTVGKGDTNYHAYYQNDYCGDVRQWFTAETNFSIVWQLTNGFSTNATTASVFVYPSHDCEVDWSTWMSETNEHLVWSYVRMDEIGPELNVDGTKQRWNGVLPVWKTVRTTP